MSRLKEKERSMPRGDTLTLEIGPVMRTVNGVAAVLDLTAAGAEFFFTAKTVSDGDATDSTALITSDPGVIVDGPAGLAELEIAAAETDDPLVFGEEDTILEYDIQMVETDGTVTTLEKGKLTVYPDITRRTA